MSISAYPIPNLINGVSQQAPSQRRDTQAQLQENCVNSPVDGSVARAGSSHVALISGADFTQAYTEDVYREDSERYRIVITDGDIRVFDIASGEEGTISFAPGSTDYLNVSGSPKNAFRTLTIEDTTFIANREKVTAMTPAPVVDPDDQLYEAFLYFKAGDYLATYTFYLTVPDYGFTYTYFIQTPSSDTAANPNGAAEIKTNAMASELFNVLAAGQGASPSLPSLGFTVSRRGNCIRIRREGFYGGDFSVDSNDGANNEKFIAIKDTVQRFAQLPSTCFDGSVLRVRGNADDSEADYYVRFEGAGSQGVWLETVKPGIPRFINEDTMPHTLISLGNNEYEFGPEAWSTRIAGDGVKKARDPSFIGTRIVDLTFIRDRLGIMTDSSLVLSKVSQFYTFFPDTVQTVLDDAPIDVRIAHTQIAILKDAVAHAEKLFLWADRVQFRVDAGDVLSQETIQVDPTTNFDYSPLIKPLGVGENIIFTYEAGKYTQVSEQFASAQGVNKDAQDITAHVPKYIPSNLRWFTGTTTLKLYVCNSPTEKNVLYVYNFFVVGEEKQQSAWSKWTFPVDHDILYARFDGHILNLMVQRPDGVTFETLDCSPSQVDEGSHYLTRLDRRITDEECSWTYEEADPGEPLGRTTVVLPYEVSSSELASACLVTRAGGDVTEGTIFRVESLSGNEAVIIGEVQADALFFFGFLPVSRYTYSTFIPKDERGALIYERTQVYAVHVAYARTGWTRAEVIFNNGRVYNNVFAGRILGSPDNVLDSVVVTDGTIRVPVKSKNDTYKLTLINDSPFPSSWQSSTVDYRPTVRASRR